RRLLRICRLLRQKHNFPAPAAHRHVRNNLFPLRAAKQLLGKGGQALCIGMHSGLDRRVHPSVFASSVSGPLASESKLLVFDSSSLATASCAITASEAAFSGNASVPGCCSSFFKSIFRSTSRGSVPSTSSAPLRLIPLFSRFFNSCFRTTSVV